MRTPHSKEKEIYIPSPQHHIIIALEMLKYFLIAYHVFFLAMMFIVPELDVVLCIISFGIVYGVAYSIRRLDDELGEPTRGLRITDDGISYTPSLLASKLYRDADAFKVEWIEIEQFELIGHHLTSDQAIRVHLKNAPVSGKKVANTIDNFGSRQVGKRRIIRRINMDLKEAKALLDKRLLYA